MHLDPLHQFRVKKIFDIALFGLDISLTNSAVAMIAAMSLCMAFLFFALRRSSGGSMSRSHAAVEMIFSLMKKALESSVGRPLSKEESSSSKYIFAIFLAILSMNILGMIPGSFAATGQFAVTLVAGMTVLFATLLVSIKKHGFGVLKSFIPHGTPLAMIPLIFSLELFSFFIRPISLCVRLGANIIAGHVMLEILAMLTVKAGVVGPFPFILMVAINLMEFAVVALQAYIFALLASVYIGNAYQH